MPRKRSDDKEQSEGYNKAFPAALRKLMRENNVTQQTLTDYLGKKNRQTVSYYCDGTSSPDWETLVKIADFFDVSVDFLLGRTNARSLTPSAVDQLGLSEKAVSNLLGPCRSPIMENAISGVNILLENIHFFFVARDTQVLKEMIEKELIYREKNKEILSLENPFGLPGPEYDLEIKEMEAYKAVKELFPEFADRLGVTIGEHYIEQARQRIISTFETCLNHCTGYYLLQFPEIKGE